MVVVYLCCMIKRKIISTILQLHKHYPAVAILGPRQVGKTTLVKEIVKLHKHKVRYLDIEKQNDADKLSDPEAFFHLHKDKCIILDEVQLMPHLFSALRPAIDEFRKPGRFILLGSASPDLVKGVSETLAGRIAYIELTPIGLLELPKNISITKHWFRGGFPSALLAKSDYLCTQWIDNFIQSYIHKDLTLLFGISFSATTMRSFWSMLAHCSGNIWNAETFARSLGISAPTVNKYVDYLEAAYLVHRLPAYFINATKRLVKAPKLYIRDSGLLHRLNNVPNAVELKENPIIGASWEGYVIEQIKQQLSAGVLLFYYRTHNGAECDAVLVKGIKVLACIEIKVSNNPTVSKGFFESIKDLKPKHKFVITPTSEDYPYKEGIMVTAIQSFLKKHLKAMQ